MNNKVKIVIISFVIILALTLGGALGYFIASQTSSNDKEKESPKIKNVKEVTDEAIKNKINQLMEIGIKMYESGEYTSFKRNEKNKYYFLTYKDLKTNGYTSVESLLSKCPENKIIITFYDEKKAEDQYPIYVNFDCEQKTSTN